MTDRPFTAEIRVRFRDLDTLGHVNNAVYATYIEQTRAEYFREVLDASLAEAETVIAHLEVDYRAPIDPEETVTVSLSIPELGTSSIPMEYAFRVDGEVVATAETVQVAWDREAEAARPIPEEWRRQIEAYEGLGGE